MQDLDLTMTGWRIKWRWHLLSNKESVVIIVLYMPYMLSVLEHQSTVYLKSISQLSCSYHYILLCVARTSWWSICWKNKTDQLQFVDSVDSNDHVCSNLCNDVFIIQLSQVAGDFACSCSLSSATFGAFSISSHSCSVWDWFNTRCPK